MNKHYQKSIRDNLPESLKFIFSPFIRGRLLKNKYFIEYYNLLKMREDLDSESIKKYQLDQLKSLLIYSYQNVPYYHDLFRLSQFDPYKFIDFQDMSKLPFLTKDLVRDNFDKLIATQNLKNGYYTATTGGTTGKPLKVLLDYDSIFKEIAYIYFYRSKLRYTFKDKLATFRGVEFDGKFWKLNPMYNEIILSPFKLSKETLQRYVTKINDYRPQYLNGYLSSIYFLARLLSEKKMALNTKLRGIFLISENIDIKQREYVEQFFNVGSSTFYGQSERCIIAEEKEKNRYAFDPYYGFTEQILFDNNTFEIVGTGFLSRIMPLIRYKINDICIPDQHLFSIESMRRSTQGLYGKNNEFFGLAALNFHSDIFKNVTNYQFIQSKKGEADLLIIVNDKFRLSDFENIRREIDRKTNGVIIFNIKKVDSLIFSRRGKFEMFISDFNNNKSHLI